MGFTAIFVWLALSCTAQIVFPESGIASRGPVTVLAIDDVALPLKHDVCLHISKPEVRKQAVLQPRRDDQFAPDQVGANCYGTVMFDDDRFRIWYYGKYYKDSGEPTQGPICYAESDDGFQWKRPNLGQVEIKGRRDNNAIKLPDSLTQGAFVIKEPNDPDPKRRYKMLYNANNGTTWVFRAATSADGIRWEAAPNFATKQFLEMSSFYRFNGRYVANGQGLTRGEGGNEGGRQGFARISADFDNWLPDEVEAFSLPEPNDPAGRGVTKPYDQVHLGVGGKPLGNVVVGLYGIWHNRPGDETRNIPWPWFGYGETSCDLGLVVSNDGLHFREPVKGHLFLSREDSPPPLDNGKQYAIVLCQSGNAIVNVGNETRIYHGRWRNGPYGTTPWEEIALATLPRDRWGGLGLFPGANEGTVWTSKIMLPAGGCEISVNADAASGVQVELADENFNLIPDLSGEHGSKPVDAKGLDNRLSWSREALAARGGKPVRLRITLRRSGEQSPMVYAIYLKP